MPHQLTTVEVAGEAKQWAGYSVLLRVVNQQDRSVVLERKVGVLADGSFTASIPAYSLADGTYLFGFAPLGPQPKAFAAGTFKVASAGAPASARQPAQTNGGQLAGHWYGVAGTVADLTLAPDGTYISGGSAHGTWRREGSDVWFTGPIEAWNKGHGKLKAKGDVIEFYWTNAAGAKQYFVIGKY